MYSIYYVKDNKADIKNFVNFHELMNFEKNLLSAVIQKC